MEPISYLGAPIRRWPIVVALAFVALIVAAIVPVGSGSPFPPNTWQASSVVALAPPYKQNTLGAKTGIKQVEFFAHLPAVIAAAANADGVPLTKGLQSDVVVTKVKKPGVAVNGLDVAVLQQSKGSAASLTNAFVAALTTYTQAQLVKQRKDAIATQQAYIAGLEKDIQELPLRSKSTTPTTTTPTTRPPSIKIKKKVVVKKPETVRHPAPHAERADTATAAALTAATVSGSQSIILVDTTSTTASTGATTTTIAGSTTLPTLPGTTATTIAGSTTQTTESLNQKAVQTENRSLAAALANATAHLSRLQAQSVAPTGIKLVTPARQKNAVLLSTSSALSNVWLRALLGLAIGAALGVIIAWLLDAFDRRIRTSKRAEEVFGLPVVIEVPAPSTKSVAVVPVVDVVVDPYSPASEAYRRLHVALLTAPPVTWVKRGYGMQEDFFELPPRPQELLVGASAPGPSSSDPGSGDVTAQMGLPVPTRPGGQLVAPRRKRFAILVTSPGDELTRSLVVVNLAAVFAEAGDRVLVATTGGMRTSFGGNGAPSTWEGSLSDVSASDLVANARPSQIPGVSSLALGQLFPNPSRLALNAAALVEAAREVVDVILLEAPLLSTQDGSALLPAADLVVVVCEAWHTTVNDGVRSQRLLAQFRPPVLGLVMTNMESRHPSVGAGTSPV